MNDASMAVEAFAQHVVQLTNVARCTAIFAAAASSAAWNDTNGAGSAVIGWSTSSGMPNEPVRTASRWMCHAFIVFANPVAAFTSSGDSPTAVGTAAR